MVGRQSRCPARRLSRQVQSRSHEQRLGVSVRSLSLTAGQHRADLRGRDEVFFDILRTYYDRYQYGNATTRDFIAIAEELSGEDLEAFFQDWLFAGQMPAIPELGLG